MVNAADVAVTGAGNPGYVGTVPGSLIVDVNTAGPAQVLSPGPNSVKAVLPWGGKVGRPNPLLIVAVSKTVPPTTAGDAVVVTMGLAFWTMNASMKLLL
jgi:hypothetical protein